MKLIGSMYLIVLTICLVLAFVFVVPSMKAQQVAGCQTLQSGLSQFNPQQNQLYPPMTAEQCLAGVDNAWFNRGFIGVVGSLVISGFGTALLLAFLMFVSSFVTDKTKKSEPE